MSIKLPFSVEKWDEDIVIVDAELCRITHADWSTTAPDMAAFVVLACNHYHALISALEDAAYMLENEGCLGSALEARRAAAKAKGQTP